jgi:hypothetical protein
MTLAFRTKEKEMSAGIILVLAAVLFPVVVQITVTVFDRIGSDRPTIVRVEQGVSGQSLKRS